MFSFFRTALVAAVLATLSVSAFAQAPGKQIALNEKPTETAAVEKNPLSARCIKFFGDAQFRADIPGANMTVVYNFKTAGDIVDTRLPDFSRGCALSFRVWNVRTYVTDPKTAWFDGFQALWRKSGDSDYYWRAIPNADGSQLKIDWTYYDSGKLERRTVVFPRKN